MQINHIGKHADIEDHLYLPAEEARETRGSIFLAAYSLLIIAAVAAIAVL